MSANELTVPVFGKYMYRMAVSHAVAEVGIENIKGQPEHFWRKFTGCGNSFIEILKSQGFLSEPKGIISELSERVRNCLHNYGINDDNVTKESLIDLVEKGVIRPNFARNFGKIAYLELCTALGLKTELAVLARHSLADLQDKIIKAELRLKSLREYEQTLLNKN